MRFLDKLKGARNFIALIMLSKMYVMTRKACSKYVRLLSSLKVKLKMSRILSTHCLKNVTVSVNYLGQYFMTKLSNLFSKCLIMFNSVLSVFDLQKDWKSWENW